MHYDAIIIGSGAGGSAAAYRMAKAGKRVWLVEKGKALPTDGSTLDTQKVINQGLFKSKETWLDNRGKPFVPEEYFNLGGKTKWYGAALLRFDPNEFDAEPEFQCLPWPIRYDELSPYYDEAEELLGVRTFPIEQDLKILVDKIDGQASGWKSAPLPLALNDAILENANEAKHFDGFASAEGLKADGQTSLLSRLSARDNFRIITGHAVKHLLSSEIDPCQVTGVMLDNAQCHTADAILLAAGAMHSPRLLQDYLNSSGLSAKLPNAYLVGNYFKRHLLTALLSFSLLPKTDVLRKTSAWFNVRYPHSSVQPLGFNQDVLSTLLPRIVPNGFFLQTEDGSHPDNKVIIPKASLKTLLPTLDYDVGRIRRAGKEHTRMRRSFQRALWKAGCMSFSRAIPLEGTAHACGTLVAGNEPHTSVVDRLGKVHGMDNLFVVDGSILPRSSRVNPALTIYAWGLYVADQLLRKSIIPKEVGTS